MFQPEDIRYGVFLMPDAKTSAAVASITGFLRAQFGLGVGQAVSTTRDPCRELADRRREEDLLEVIDGVAGRHVPFQIWNSGIRRLGDPRWSSTFIVLPRGSRTLR